ncbi:MAG TPA: NAD(P)H-binding protein [Chitinophagaceae bacterium]|nr:NAD(P)H-binding protein [Chitinophagaceae bacterium]
MNTELKIDERPIVVLGASGRVGNIVAHQLLEKGMSIRAVARHPEKLKDLEKKGAEIWIGAIEEQDLTNTVFANAKAAFVLAPGDTASPDLHEEQRKNNEHIVEAIKQSGRALLPNQSRARLNPHFLKRIYFVLYLIINTRVAINHKIIS